MDQNPTHFSRFPSDSGSGVPVQSCCGIAEGDSNEDYDFSDVVLKYISQMLMEEDIEGKTCMFQESASLQAAEKSFYEALGEKYPPSPDHYPIHSLNQNIESPDECYASPTYTDYNTTGSTNNFNLVGAGWSPVFSHHQSAPADIGSRSTFQSSVGLSSSAGIVMDGLVDSPASALGLPDMFNNRQSAGQ